MYLFFHSDSYTKTLFRILLQACLQHYPKNHLRFQMICLNLTLRTYAFNYAFMPIRFWFWFWFQLGTRTFHKLHALFHFRNHNQCTSMMSFSMQGFHTFHKLRCLHYYQQYKKCNSIIILIISSGEILITITAFHSSE